MPTSDKTPQALTDYDLASRFDSLRVTLAQDQFADRRQRPLSYWALPTDRGLPRALLDRTVQDVMSMGFDHILAVPAIGQKKMGSLILLLSRAAQHDGPRPASVRSKLRIAVADDVPDMRVYLKTILSRMGHEVVVVAETGKQLVDQCRSKQPELVITDIKMPDMDGIRAAEELCKIRPVPIILVSAYHDAQWVDRAEADYILAYLVKPIKQADLEPAIGIAMRRFEQFEALRKESADLRHALEGRELIERATGILMERAGLEEEDAFRRLEKLARDENKKLVETAQMIVRTDEAFRPSG